ncbi:chemotaxis protein CheD [Oceanobacillus piezotolerans]|uniref:Probable chemoreceptor glutamine deamidase CheD n=1 Tax=Oceanobacillus piezotolerans TaxID=2448030 RepID=A0A498D6H8_9BACI|nr:chemotaxis protein CheD [Oceanobacillus piezotolerans]RLL45338.1 chemotaxis protein CheD [Oceanobacillus piezotolerans]
MNEQKTVVKVGIADLNFVKAPNVIRTSGLGSCVGVVVYDDRKEVAGLSHVLLPDSSLARQKEFNLYKFADTAIPILVTKLLDQGARKFALRAKMAGGAQMFTSSNDMMRIGSRNILAVKEMLEHYQIPIVASDVGGNVGRTIEFDPETSRLKIKKVNKEEFYL